MIALTTLPDLATHDHRKPPPSPPLPARAVLWATSAIDRRTADTTPMDISALGAHVDRCNGLRGPMFGLQCAADALSGFLAPRIRDHAVVVAIVIGVGSLLI